jgi:hypothetical protein
MTSTRRRKSVSDERRKSAHAPKRTSKPAGAEGDEIAADVVSRGRRVLSRIKSQLKDYPLGDFVIVNIETSEHVIAHTLTEAVDLFTTRFPNAKGGYVHRIGEAAV